MRAKWVLASIALTAVLLALALFVFLDDDRSSGDLDDAPSPSAVASQSPRRVGSPAVDETEIRSSAGVEDRTAESDGSEEPPAAEGSWPYLLEILDEDLQAIASARIHIHRPVKTAAIEEAAIEEDEIEDEEPSDIGITDAAGCFTGRFPEPSIQIRVLAEHHLTSELFEIRGGPERRMILLYRAARASGVVLDIHGNPLPGARVHLEKWPLGREDRKRSVISDGAGRFAFDLSLFESFQLWASHGEVETQVLRISFHGRGERSDLVLQMPGRFSVTGQVKTEDAEPAAGARVFIAELRERNEVTRTYVRSAYSTWVESDTEGRFSLDLPSSGHYVLWAQRSPGERTLPTEVEVDARSAGVDIALQFAPESTITVRVYDAAGLPIQGAEVQAWYLEPARSEDDDLVRENEVMPVRVETDETGMAKIRGLFRDASYRLLLTYGDPKVYFERSPVTARGQDYVFRLTEAETPRCGLDGVLVTALDQKPIAGCTIDLYRSLAPDQEILVGSRTTATDGRFSFIGLQQGGPYRVQSRPHNAPTAAVIVEALHGEIRVTLEQPQVLSVVLEIVDSQGRAIACRSVQLSLQSPMSYGLGWGSSSDEEGRCEVELLWSGRYELSIGGRPDLKQEITLSPDQESPLRVVVPVDRR